MVKFDAPTVTDLVPLFESDGQSFEGRGRSNGGHFWSAREFGVMLGYESYDSFRQAINKAVGTCTTLQIAVLENFQQCERVVDGQIVGDYKLSRFACYLVAMNGDSRKPQVAMAQVYFASLAEAARRFMEDSQAVERVQIRDEVSDRERSLTSAAKKAGVDQYQFFQNEGYRGMYNMNLSALKERKGLTKSGRSLLDFMDKRELAGNLFRITETEERLKKQGTRGQKAAQDVAYDVGKQVRRMMVQNGGTPPEDIPLAEDIKVVKKELKQTHRQLRKIDAKRITGEAPDEDSGDAG